ncbi:MAG: hypothetical protein LBN10_08755 [Propionibacteriaceae bacterium]|nr:hypothetical protein [Propionibacteriaceae bacterium]
MSDNEQLVPRQTNATTDPAENNGGQGDESRPGAMGIVDTEDTRPMSLAEQLGLTEVVKSAWEEFDGWRHNNERNDRGVVAWTWKDEYPDFDTWIANEVKKAVIQMAERKHNGTELEPEVQYADRLKVIRSVAELWVKGEATGPGPNSEPEVQAAWTELTAAPDGTPAPWDRASVLQELAKNALKSNSLRPRQDKTFNLDKRTLSISSVLQSGYSQEFLLTSARDNISTAPFKSWRAPWKGRDNVPNAIFILVGLVVCLVLAVLAWAVADIVDETLLDLPLGVRIAIVIVISVLSWFLFVALSEKMNIWYCKTFPRMVWIKESDKFRKAYGIWESETLWAGDLAKKNQWEDGVIPLSALSSEAAVRHVWELVRKYVRQFHSFELRVMPLDRIRMVEEDLLVTTQVVAQVKNMLRGERRIAIGLAGPRGFGKTASLRQITSGMTPGFGKCPWLCYRPRLWWRRVWYGFLFLVPLFRGRARKNAHNMWSRHGEQDSSLVVSVRVPANYDHRQFVQLVARQVVRAISSSACQIGHRHLWRQRWGAVVTALLSAILLVWIAWSWAVAGSRRCAAPRCWPWAFPFLPGRGLAKLPSVADSWLSLLVVLVVAAGFVVVAQRLWMWAWRNKSFDREDEKRRKTIREARQTMDPLAPLADPESRKEEGELEVDLNLARRRAKAIIKVALEQHKGFRHHYPRVVKAMNRVRTLLGDAWWQRMRFKLSWGVPMDIEVDTRDDVHAQDVLILLQTLETLLDEYSRSGQAPLTVLVDEADKPEKKDRVIAFNELKDLFNLNHVRWVVTVRPQDRERFVTRRLMQDKTYLDSIFHEIVRLDALSYETLKEIVDKRTDYFPCSHVLVALCAAWSGGVPRDFVRLLWNCQWFMETNTGVKGDAMAAKFREWILRLMDEECVLALKVDPHRAMTLKQCRNRIEEELLDGYFPGPSNSKTQLRRAGEDLSKEQEDAVRSILNEVKGLSSGLGWNWVPEAIDLDRAGITLTVPNPDTSESTTETSISRFASDIKHVASLVDYCTDLAQVSDPTSSGKSLPRKSIVKGVSCSEVEFAVEMPKRGAIVLEALWRSRVIDSLVFPTADDETRWTIFEELLEEAKIGLTMKDVRDRLTSRSLGAITYLVASCFHVDIHPGLDGPKNQTPAAVNRLVLSVALDDYPPSQVVADVMDSVALVTDLGCQIYAAAVGTPPELAVVESVRLGSPLEVAQVVGEEVKGVLKALLSGNFLWTLRDIFTRAGRKNHDDLIETVIAQMTAEVQKTQIETEKARAETEKLLAEADAERWKGIAIVIDALVKNRQPTPTSEQLDRILTAHHISALETLSNYSEAITVQ